MLPALPGLACCCLCVQQARPATLHALPQPPSPLSLLLAHNPLHRQIGFFGVMVKGGKGTVLMEYAEGRDLHSALEVVAAGTRERLFGWYRRGRRVALVS